MASLGRLSAGLIHEINNPLHYVSQALHVLKTRGEKVPEADRGKYLEVVSDITEGVQRVQRIVSDLRAFTHPHSQKADLVELEWAVSTALRLLSHEFKDRVKVEVKIPSGQRVFADRNKLTQVFLGLLQNSLDAFKNKNFGEREPAVTIRSRQEDGRVSVALWDNGSGIAREHLDKVFDPFFTTKDVGEGMGLGLSICYRILREQGADISVKSEPGEYTEFVLDLPAKA
jgi:two-component system sensor histidine kinase PhcS